MSLFRFKQFSVSHDYGMKIGTDAVLLGAWVPIQSVKNALDIGTGTGIIALMMAQRGVAAITGIEIDEKSVEEARHNINRSLWKEKIEIFQGDFCNTDFVHLFPKFDLIVSNPPFFVDSLKSPFKNRNTTRHSDSLPFEILINHAKQLLNSDGKLCIILPVNESEIFSTLAKKQQLYPETICDILPYPDANPNRKMITFQKKKMIFHYEKLCIRNSDRSYSSEYKLFTQDFYLNLDEKQKDKLES